MSSKVSVERRADHVRPFAWRTVALNGETQDRRKGATDAKTPPAAAPSVIHESRVAELEKLAEKRAREAREAGRAEGEAQAKAQAQEEVRATIERLASAIAELDQYRVQLLRQTETDAVRLSIAIARRVLRRELTVDPAAIEGLVRAALERLQSQESCRVRMHPDLVPALRDCVERMGMEGRVEVISDAAQEPGAAVFETSRGSLNASIDSQLKEIERGLADRFQSQR
jgi:flagellar assembly protein FliH